MRREQYLKDKEGDEEVIISTPFSLLSSYSPSLAVFYHSSSIPIYVFLFLLLFLFFLFCCTHPSSVWLSKIWRMSFYIFITGMLTLLNVYVHERTGGRYWWTNCRMPVTVVTCLTYVPWCGAGLFGIGREFFSGE